MLHTADAWARAVASSSCTGPGVSVATDPTLVEVIGTAVPQCSIALRMVSRTLATASHMPHIQRVLRVAGQWTHE